MVWFPVTDPPPTDRPILGAYISVTGKWNYVIIYNFYKKTRTPQPNIRYWMLIDKPKED